MSVFMQAPVAGVPLGVLILLLFPGFVALRTYGLFVPLGDKPAKDYVIETLSFGLVNFAFNAWAVAILLDGNANEVAAWLAGIWALVVCPALLALAFRWLQRSLTRRQLILSPHRTPWDDVFTEREPYWIIAHLPDGTRIGGKFFARSRASLHPQPGHLYIEELWKLEPETGAFVEAVPGSKGVLLRPTDYRMIELFEEGTDE